VPINGVYEAADTEDEDDLSPFQTVNS
jgi:hypothetical protein